MAQCINFYAKLNFHSLKILHEISLRIFYVAGNVLKDFVLHDSSVWDFHNRQLNFPCFSKSVFACMYAKYAKCKMSVPGELGYKHQAEYNVPKISWPCSRKIFWRVIVTPPYLCGKSNYQQNPKVSRTLWGFLRLFVATLAASTFTALDFLNFSFIFELNLSIWLISMAVSFYLQLLFSLQFMLMRDS